MMCQPLVCMSMRNTISAYCSLEVASNHNTIPSDNIPDLEAIYNYKTTGASMFLLIPCMECCGHANCLRIP